MNAFPFCAKYIYTYAKIPAVLKCHKDVKSDMLFSIPIGNTYLNIFICIRVSCTSTEYR